MKSPQAGFTLIELLIAMFIAVIVLGVTATAFAVTVRSTAESTTRLSTSQDSGFASTFFVKDVQSAQSLSTATAGCGAAAGELVLSLEWTDLTATEQVDYRYEQLPGGGTLTRQRCGSTVGSAIIARHLVSRPTLACDPDCAAPRALTLRLDGQDADTDVTATRRTP